MRRVKHPTATHSGQLVDIIHAKHQIDEYRNYRDDANLRIHTHAQQKIQISALFPLKPNGHTQIRITDVSQTNPTQIFQLCSPNGSNQRYTQGRNANVDR